MKLSLLLVLCCCLLGLALGDSLLVTMPPFIRSRYSLRWRKTTTTTTMAPPEATTAPALPAQEAVTPSVPPRLATSTANVDYDYYGNGESDNTVHK
ncbi:uncharacterized protein LOC110186956 [Drosophila serrata]|uniref:uncharacterized protein LOC110186956 n=1 Tax=Drosophila serrata TaxID=7274 RepID=UPI000A1D1102|nr:uncharacterized protein LOC110186956 [Drosophila serrata]KAH8355879.1 hypothetical protein KR200_000115 [Drosophila serrata]